MSADSGGLQHREADLATELPKVIPSMEGGSRRRDICRKKDFELVCSNPVDVSAVVGALVSLVDPPQLLEGVQQINSQKYVVSFKSVAGAEYFHSLSQKLSIPGTAVACKWLGAEFKRVRVAFLPLAVSNEQLIATLQNYGRVVQVTEELYQNTPIQLKTGTRLVDMEMNTPVPNLISVCGFTVPATYRGVVVQCRRCLQPGHIKKECNTPYCDRCRSFGHGEDACAAPCLKCKSAGHHWRECTVRSYAFAMTTSVAEADPIPSAVALAEERANSPVQQQTLSLVTADDCKASSAKETPKELGAADDLFETSAMDTGLDDVTSVATAALADITCNERADFKNGPPGNTEAPNAGFRSAFSNKNSEDEKEAASAPKTEVSNQGLISGDAVDSGVIEKAKGVSDHLVWKMAITRSKRKLLAGTTGSSPALKKSVQEKAIDEKN